LEDTVETELEEDPGLWWKEPVKRTARELAEAVTRTRGTIWMNRRC
jgi:hypothetical protein